MEVTALCIRLLVSLLMLLVAHVQPSYSQKSASDGAVRIVPTRLQTFEYESVSFTCFGVNVSAGWSVRNAKEFLKACSNVDMTSTLNCTIGYPYKSDSGEYWCEGGGGARSNTVNITVTAGSVILESPVLPVMEGEDVTLSCTKKKTSSNLPADFYKDGLRVGSSSTGEMIIHRVSKSDEGNYKCNISGAGDSPESWLHVRDGSVILDSPDVPVKEGDPMTLRCRNKNTSSNLKADFYKNGRLFRSSSTGELTIHSVSKSDEGLYKCRISGTGESPGRQLSVKEESPTYDGSEKKSEDSNAERTDRTVSKQIYFSRHYFVLLWIVIIVVLVLQLLVIGLLYRKKQLVLLEARMNDPNKDLHDVIRKDKKKEGAADAADNLSLYRDTNHGTKPQTEKGQEESLSQSLNSSFSDDDTSQALQNESDDPPLTDSDAQYASIDTV
ncbi:high affinity immunoglobulin gamma Fc receptor IB-like [Acanthopagrus latus]|uniref:high affinity immunoglobulin gamma Fc receptor IB-like n=1 Tax=Acanthopagrus latus TaxID=8177 RepID=UPI00187C8CF6|nr:high affinity immunoglobulin gamma Fc receptor IB-like [Acanthopagrus latus]